MTAVVEDILTVVAGIDEGGESRICLETVHDVGEEGGGIVDGIVVGVDEVRSQGGGGIDG